MEMVAVRSIAIVLVMCAVFVSLALSADKPTLRRQTAWIVAPGHTGEIRVKVGDVVQIESEMLPVIPMHLGKTFKVGVKGRFLQTIGSLPPEGEGAFHSSFYFKAVAAGRATVTVALRDAEGKQLQTWEYVVVVESGKS